MRKLTILALLTACILAGQGCYNYGSPTGLGPTGALVTSATIGVSGQPGGSLTGKSCVRRIYAFAVFGGGGLDEAARDGNINIIKSVDKEIFNILGLYSHMCTVVRGEQGETPKPTGGAVSGFNDVVVLKNGATFTNCKAAVTADSVVVTTSDGKTIVLRKAEVQSVQKK
jgi:hypothetical protein